MNRLKKISLSIRSQCNEIEIVNNIINHEFEFFFLRNLYKLKKKKQNNQFHSPFETI